MPMTTLSMQNLGFGNMANVPASTLDHMQMLHTAINDPVVEPIGGVIATMSLNELNVACQPSLSVAKEGTTWKIAVCGSAISGPTMH